MTAESVHSPGGGVTAAASRRHGREGRLSPAREARLVGQTEDLLEVVVVLRDHPERQLRLTRKRP